MMRHSTYLYSFFTLLLASLLAVIAFVYYADPYQIYHRHDLGLINNQRYQNAGLINTHLTDPSEGYDSVMIGSSLSDNFTSSDAQQYLGWQKTLRLFIDGGSPAEQALIAHHALSKPQTRHLLWEIRPRAYWDTKSEIVLDKNIFPTYLYNKNPLDDLPYFLNTDIIKWAYYKQAGYVNFFLKTPDTIGHWGDLMAINQHNSFNSIKNISDLKIQADLMEDLGLDDEKEPDYPLIRDYIFPIVQTHCNNSKIELVFYIPPVTKQEYLFSGKIGGRGIIIQRFLLNAIGNCNNMSLHVFDLEPFSNDLANYKDQEHYMPDINKKILELIGKKSNVLTLENIDDHEKKLLKAINEYKVYSSYKG